ALFSFLKQSFKISKLLGFKNIESLVFEAFLSKTEKTVVFLAATIYGNCSIAIVRGYFVHNIIRGDVIATSNCLS
ncbi:hypothetical protein, partial [Saccharicrinis fermentans]|uniref:hypothetical protein n=1 Tax=Saccharicrinis fermentans TaxID=982 RepID=UPI001F3520FB